MTFGEAIAAADAIRENEVPTDAKRKWLAALDGALWNDVVGRYEGGEAKPEYDEDLEPEVFDEYDLMIQPPYDSVYVDYLVARIDLANGDIDRYNNGSALYERQRQNWANYYNRTHRWKNPTPGLRF